ncbi:MAG: SGNH/GDSL hydrolase family protein [Fimbriimonadales bacterium]
MNCSWIRRLSIVSLVLAYVGAMGANYSHIYVFGDSLSDTGNVKILTFGFYPPSPYWNGRFSNGPVWIETTASKYGLPVNPSLGGGTNYAFGGAETGSGYSHSNTPNIGTQINMFRQNVGTFLSSDLVVLFIGGNDFLNGQTNPQIPLSNIQSELQRLYGYGARQFLVANLPLLGYIPSAYGTAEQDVLNVLSSSFNKGLAELCFNFRVEHPAASVTLLDIQRFFMLVRANPLSFGFTNITDSYMDEGSGDPDRYLFWDTVHPTRVAHAGIGNFAFQRLGP